MMPLANPSNQMTPSLCKKSKLYNIAFSVDDFRLDGLPNRAFRFIRIILEDMVHLLKGAAHSLRNKEIGPDTREYTEYREEDVCAVSGV